MEITQNTVDEFVESIEPNRKEDILQLLSFFKDVTKQTPKMWGSIVGYGRIHYRYESGHEGYMPLVGFANRKQAMTLYVFSDINNYPELKMLGKYKTGKSCLYVRKLEDIDMNVLKAITEKGIEETLANPFNTLVE